jgi:uncharacterized protein
MRIAVIGGGASGLVAAWLLDEQHDVVVFEREPNLGGHIRTLGLNVECPRLPPGCILDAGVIEFSPERFPTVHRLMSALDVELHTVPGCTTLLRPDRARVYAPRSVREAGLGPGKRFANWRRLLKLRPHHNRFEERAAALSPPPNGATLGDFLEPGPFGTWMKLLVTYAFSIPYERVEDVPAILAVPMLQEFAEVRTWTQVAGGTYRYIERLLEQFSGTVHTSATVSGVRRTADGVLVALADGSEAAFDALVFAAPPDQLLPMLQDPTDAEQRRFAAWRANHAHTVVHDDRGLYERRGERYACEFDVFELADGSGGYNALLDRLEDLPTDDEQQFGLALGLDSEIDPARILHIQEHHTPDYTSAALRWRHEVIATNGDGRIWYAGAWLGDGLHEGAVCSALAVSRGLGGREI